MGTIPDRVIDEVRERADVVQVVGRYVHLKRSSNRYWGLCPFHNEKTPSFAVTPEKQIFHCFGCGVGGDVFAFRMRHDGLDFPDAVRALADEFGVLIPEGTDSGTNRSAALYKLNEGALDFFRDALRSAEGGEARAYLDRRGLPQDLRDRFQLGFAPARWDGLIEHLRAQGESLDEAQRAGLIAARQNERGHYDRFRGRVIFPIREPSGRLVGFGGRALGDETPKYLNSPESPVYQKGRALFGLSAAVESIRERGRVIVVEGYFDLFAVHRAGHPECVAPCGTALTRAHAARLRRYAPECVLLFDGDEAGRRAAERSLPVLLEEGLRVRAAFLPAGLDPDTLLQDQGPEALHGVIDRARPLVEHLIDTGLAELPAQPSAWQIADAVGSLRGVLQALPDRLERATHVRQIAGRLDVPIEEVDQALRREAPRSAERQQPTSPAEPPRVELADVDPVSRVLIGSLTAYPDLAPLCDGLDLDGLPEGPGRRLLACFQQALAAHGERAVPKLLSPAAGELPAELEPVLSELAALDRWGSRAAAEKAVQDCVAQLELRVLQQESQRIKRALESCNDPIELESLLERKQRILSLRNELWSRVQQV